jgi:anti-anti-sigma factor
VLGPTPDLSADVSRRDGVVWATPRGELDLATAPQLEALLPPLGAGDALVLDLRELRFIDSSGIRFLMLLDMRARAQQWTLTLVAVDGTVRRVLDLCRIPDRIRTVEDPDDAV